MEKVKPSTFSSSEIVWILWQIIWENTCEQNNSSFNFIKYCCVTNLTCMTTEKFDIVTKHDDKEQKLLFDCILWLKWNTQSSFWWGKNCVACSCLMFSSHLPLIHILINHIRLCFTLKFQPLAIYWQVFVV